MLKALETQTERKLKQLHAQQNVTTQADSTGIRSGTEKKLI